MEELKISIEKQIVVDPLSLKESSTKKGFFETSLPTSSTTLVTTTDSCPPALLPPKPKFLSFSLPNSANSSPWLTSAMFKKRSKAQSIESPCHGSNLAPKHQDLRQEINLRRSKSCGEGRECAPSDECDLWMTEPSAVKRNNRHQDEFDLWMIEPGAVKRDNRHPDEFDLRFTKPSLAKHDNRHHENFSKIEAIDQESPASGEDPLEVPPDKGFKCSALCLYLPGFGKAKPVKARKEGLETEGAIISRTVSMEKFECGSWASSALFLDIVGGDSKRTYFDLPMELIKFNANDVDAPISSAFVFEKDLNGVLKNGSSRTSARKSDASPRHVRFSTSSSMSHPASPASCVTPSLRKAREDFNAFLEAKSA